MSDFDTAFEEATDELQEYFGEPGTYHPLSGDDVPFLLGSFSEVEEDIVPNYAGADRVQRTRLFLDSAEVADPVINARITRTATEETFAIVERSERAGNAWELQLELTEPYERTTERFRLRR